MVRYEQLQKAFDQYKKIHPAHETGRETIRRLELRIGDLEAENVRLKDTALYATQAWMTYARKFHMLGADKIALGIAI
jgi:hypothetical protein